MPSDDESSNNTLYLSGDEWLQSTGEDEGSLNSVIQPCQVEPIALLMWKNET